jgi:hypothetical protein
MQKPALIFVVYPEHAFQKAKEWAYLSKRVMLVEVSVSFFKRPSTCFSLDT